MLTFGVFDHFGTITDNREKTESDGRTNAAMSLIKQTLLETILQFYIFMTNTAFRYGKCFD